jgi:hypothetical protein
LGFAVFNRAFVVFQNQVGAVCEGVGFFADSGQPGGLDPGWLEWPACPWVAAFAVGAEGLGFWVEAVFLEIVAVGSGLGSGRLRTRSIRLLRWRDARESGAAVVPVALGEVAAVAFVGGDEAADAGGDACVSGEVDEVAEAPRSDALLIGQQGVEGPEGDLRVW